MGLTLLAAALAAAQGAQLRQEGRLRGVDGTIGFSRPGVLTFAGGHSVAVTRLDGSPVAQARWPSSGPSVLDSGVSVSPDGRSFAFRLSNARPGASAGAAVVYVLDAAQQHARAVYQHRLGPSGCGVGAAMSWDGGHLLYSSVDGRRAIVDTRSSHRVDLAPLARSLPRLSPDERADVYWASALG